MIRWSCQRAPRMRADRREADPERVGERRGAARAARPSAPLHSANVSQRPVRTSTSDAISSPTRCGSSSVPRAACWTSSKRLTSSRVPGSRSANSSSTATVKSGPSSKAASRRRQQLLVADLLLFTHGRSLVRERLEEPLGDAASSSSCARPRGALRGRAPAARASGSASSSRSRARGRRRLRRERVRCRCSGGYSAAIPPRPRRGPSGRRRAVERRRPPPPRRPCRTPPGRSDGTTATSQSGSRWTRCRCSSAPVKSVPGGASASSSRGSRRSRRSRRALASRAAPRAARGRLCSRSASRSRRRSAARRRRTREARGVVCVRMALVAVRRVAARLLDERRERRRHGARARIVDVDAGRHLVDAVDVSDHVLEHARGCARSRRTPPSAPASASAPQRSSSALPRIEYSSSEPCAFTAKRAPLARADRGAEQHVVREDEVGGQQLAQRRARSPRRTRRAARGVKSCSRRASRPS